MDKVIKIRVICAGVSTPEKQFRVLADVLPYQDFGVELSLSYNSTGAKHIECEIDHSFAKPTMVLQAIAAEKEGADAIVIESMGDTGLIECREAVSIPVVGMSDSSLRLAQMLGRKFGLISAGKWHGYAVERLMNSYGIVSQYCGFECLDAEPFVDFEDNESVIGKQIMSAIDKLIDKGADTIVFGGSYFIGKDKELSEMLNQEKYKDLVIIDPFPLAIRFARMLVDSNLSHSKRIYANPRLRKPVYGFQNIQTTPGVLN